MTYEDRRQWFLERAGKVVYRNRTTCPCIICAEIYEEGLTIKDELQAKILSDWENVHEGGVESIRYFDTLEERDEYEKTLK